MAIMPLTVLAIILHGLSVCIVKEALYYSTNSQQYVSVCVCMYLTNCLHIYTRLVPLKSFTK